MTTPTLKQEALERALTDIFLREYVLQMRRDGHSWRRIAISLTQDTGIDVTGEALRQWYGDAA